MSEKLIAVPESLLTGIADKIREKTDDDILIPVPLMPNYIDLIGSAGVSIKRGILIPDSIIKTSVTINHNLGQSDYIFILWTGYDDCYGNGDAVEFILAVVGDIVNTRFKTSGSDSYAKGYMSRKASNGTYQTNTTLATTGSNHNVVGDENSITVALGTNVNLPVGVAYNWLCLAVSM